MSVPFSILYEGYNSVKSKSVLNSELTAINSNFNKIISNIPPLSKKTLTLDVSNYNILDIYVGATDNGDHQYFSKYFVAGSTIIKNNSYVEGQTDINSNITVSNNTITINNPLNWSGLEVKILLY